MWGPKNGLQQYWTSEICNSALQSHRRRKNCVVSEKETGFDILKSNNLTKEFHGRFLEFFSNECTVQIFMIWISPVASFERREFLALESVFKVHPHGCLLILSRDMDSIQGCRILKPLLDHKYRVAAITWLVLYVQENSSRNLVWRDEEWEQRPWRNSIVSESIKPHYTCSFKQVWRDLPGYRFHCPKKFCRLEERKLEHKVLVCPRTGQDWTMQF